MSGVDGSRAPEIRATGVDADGTVREFRLDEFRGRNVVLAFYPGDFTPVCTRQLCSYRDHFDEFVDLDAVVLGISPQGVESHEKFRNRFHFPFPLLADADQSIGRAYGVLGALGYRRSVFVLDADGIVRWHHIAPLAGLTYQGTRKIKHALAELSRERNGPRGSSG